jgi:hypothetical protein
MHNKSSKFGVKTTLGCEELMEMGGELNRFSGSLRLSA